MHEASVASAILKRATAIAESSTLSGDKKLIASEQSERQESNFEIVKIEINVGEFRNIDAESLQFAFSALRKDFRHTKNTELKIVSIKALASCADMEHKYIPCPSNYFSCTVCGAGIGSLLSGEELDIVDIEIEEIPLSNKLQTFNEVC